MYYFTIEKQSLSQPAADSSLYTREPPPLRQCFADSSPCRKGRLLYPVLLTTRGALHQCFAGCTMPYHDAVYENKNKAAVICQMFHKLRLLFVHMLFSFRSSVPIPQGSGRCQIPRYGFWHPAALAADDPIPENSQCAIRHSFPGL